MQGRRGLGRTARIAAVAAFALTVFGCRKPEVGAGPDAGPMLIGAENAAVVKREAIQAGPQIAGSLEAREQARVRAELGGSVLSVSVDLGQAVKKRQVLARIEDVAVRNAFRSARSAVTSAQLEYENARRQSERTQKLVEGGALAPRDLEVAQSARSAAEARVAQARAQLAQVQQQLDAATVKSPIAGVVSERAVNEGDVVAPGAPLFTVIDPSSMRLEATVPSDSLSALKVGTPVDFQVRGYPNQTFRGEIEHIAPAADPVTRQITVLVSIPNPGGKLVAGLFAEGRVAAQTRQTLVAPTAAIDRRGSKPAVTVVREGKAQKIEVGLGLRDPQTERVEVQGEVREGDVLLMGVAMEVAPGTPVQLSRPPADAGE